MNDFLKKNLEEVDGILRLKLNNSIVKKVSEFYTSNPFPNYKIDDDKISILEKGNKNLLANQFKKFVGHNKKILEIGCGTGQLSTYFSIGNNNLVVAMDATLQSLKIAKNFAKKNDIQNLIYVNADIFEDVLVDEYFDFIWCNGVLHHTKDPNQAFNVAIKSLKKNGYVLIGLYNKFGRLRTLIRKLFYKIIGLKFLEIFDPTLKKLKISKNEKLAWIRDQYNHPQESLHTLDEILNWFEKNKIDFISSIPTCDFIDNNYEEIFKKRSKGNYFYRLLSQILMIFNSLGSDGGLFIIIGKKRDD
ncbi:class I SAM-dependent methyltransferase [Candidatus Pelagibacter bacterium]|nr:class I SAM-dependent methyltransferase [Candidatus Pelagibacter bacterium]